MNMDGYFGVMEWFRTLHRWFRLRSTTGLAD